MHSQCLPKTVRERKRNREKAREKERKKDLKRRKRERERERGRQRERGRERQTERQRERGNKLKRQTVLMYARTRKGEIYRVCLSKKVSTCEQESRAREMEVNNELIFNSLGTPR